MKTHVGTKNIPPRVQYTANGILTTYEFTFAIFKNSDLKVYFNDILQGASTYKLNTVKKINGGTVMFFLPPKKDTIITLVRCLNIERTTDFQEGGTLRADTLNYELDYQIACQQQIADTLNRSMVLPPYAVNTNIDLTLPLPQAGKAIVWNAEGTNLENSTVSINALEGTLNEYKTTAETAAQTASLKADLASDAAIMATNQANIALQGAEEVLRALPAKTNTDMDNVSAAGKTTVVNWFMPDYNRAIAKDTSIPCTVTDSGWYTIYISKNTLNSTAKVQVNGMDLENLSISDAWETSIFLIPLNKGDSLTSSGSVFSSSIKKYVPFKGV